MEKRSRNSETRYEGMTRMVYDEEKMQNGHPDLLSALLGENLVRLNLAAKKEKLRKLSKTA